MKKFRCKICGVEFEAESIENAVCPKCGAKGDKLEEIPDKSNPYSGTQTEKNLEMAFAGESQARNKYTYFASVAKKEGFEQISAIFLKTAENEKEHAKMWFKELKGIGNTAQNLAAAADGEYQVARGGAVSDLLDGPAAFHAVFVRHRMPREGHFDLPAYQVLTVLGDHMPGGQAVPQDFLQRQRGPLDTFGRADHEHAVVVLQVINGGTGMRIAAHLKALRVQDDPAVFDVDELLYTGVRIQGVQACVQQLRDDPPSGFVAV